MSVDFAEPISGGSIVTYTMCRRHSNSWVRAATATTAVQRECPICSSERRIAELKGPGTNGKN